MVAVTRKSSSLLVHKGPHSCVLEDWIAPAKQTQKPGAALIEEQVIKADLQDRRNSVETTVDKNCRLEPGFSNVRIPGQDYA